MESNEQTELTRKNRDNCVDREQADSSGAGELGSGRIEKIRKRTHEHGQQCGDCGEDKSR